MKFRLLTFVLIFALIFTAPANAQKNLPSEFTQAVAAATAFNFPLPSPQPILADPENDMWPAVPPTPPPSTPGTPPQPAPGPRPILDLVSVQAKSNGMDTVLALVFTSRSEVRKTQGEVCLDTDQNPATGYDYRYENGNQMFRPGIGCDAGISLYNIPNNGTVNVYSRFKNGGRDIPVQVVGQSLVMVISNDEIGEFGDGNMNVAVLVNDGNSPIDVVPNNGYGTITSLRELSISPDSTIMLVSQSFDMAIVVEADSPHSLFQKMVFYDGENLTAAFESSQIVGDLPGGSVIQRPGGSRRIRAGKTFRYRVPAGSMSPGPHTVGVMIVGSDGIAAKQVEFLVLPGSDAGSDSGK